MTWIRTIEAIEDADGELEALYRQLVSASNAGGSTADRAAGQIDAILAVHSLHPRSLEAHLGLYRTLMHGPSELSRIEREMIAVAVSSANGCEY